MSDVVMLSKYQIVAGEDPEVTALRLHMKKNRPVDQAEEMGMEFPAYRFTPYPTAMYRDWEGDERENEIHRLSAKHMLDLEKRRDRLAVEAMVGPYKTINVGIVDFVRYPDHDDVISEVRERNEREHAARLEEGWADRPADVRAAKRAFEIRTAAAPAAQTIYEDRHLSPAAKAEFDAINEAASDHVVNVADTRKQLQDSGALPKGKK